jgi:uncharacterized protein YdeI (YjbR/CyaY-like superfamily)
VDATFFETPSELRNWLEESHDQVEELWFGFYKKGSGRTGITYQEALDEALCFGWIDGVRKSLDESRYKIRFTPRKPGSIWSLVNIARVQELIQQGRMAPPGLRAFEARDEKKSKQYSYEERSRELDAAYQEIFKENPKAWDFFRSQPPGYRRVASWYVQSAKKEETRRKRLAELIEVSGKGLRLPQVAAQPKRRGTPGAVS